LTESVDDHPEETNQSEAKSNDTEIISKSEEPVDDNTNQGFVAKLKRRFGDQKFNRASLAKLGTSVPLCYGLISNVFGITCVSIAWFLASRRVRKKIVYIKLYVQLLASHDILLFRLVYPHWHLVNGKDSWQCMLHSLHFSTLFDQLALP
jgi:hypothetical protein